MANPHAAYPSLAKPSVGTITPFVGQRSTFGNQVRSTVPSNPSYPFGTATREGLVKRFISNEHIKTASVEVTPGPGTYTHQIPAGWTPTSTSGRRQQALSTTPTLASWKFGSAERFERQIKEWKRQAAIPGPGAYTIC